MAIVWQSTSVTGMYKECTRACMSAWRYAKIKEGLTFSKASYWVGTGSGAQPEPEEEPDELASAPESMASAMSSDMTMGSIMGAMVGADEGPLA